MRLLKAQTLEFVDFDDDRSTPPYAILSHTWTSEEVSYQDMLEGAEHYSKKQGSRKIRLCSQQAIEDGLDFCWIDTCCIDKKSSAELSEAINSMFRWYKSAKVCYTYLSDVPRLPPSESPTPSTPNISAETHKTWKEKFATSRWFTRGWTLQELIAPRHVNFFSNDWQPIGTKITLRWDISTITKIPSDVLAGANFLEHSISRRMSWASSRTTTRIEDMAYSLLGLFNINMPMLYGEGQRAFIRLQEEIIKSSADTTIFCWTDPSATFATGSGLLAPSPVHFAKSGSIERDGRSTPYRMTNMGLKLKVPIIPREGYKNECVAFFPGVYGGLDHVFAQVVGIYLARLQDELYVRVDSNTLWGVNVTGLDDDERPTSTLIVPQILGLAQEIDISRIQGVMFKAERPDSKTFLDPSSSAGESVIFYDFHKRAKDDALPKTVPVKWREREHRGHKMCTVWIELLLKELDEDEDGTCSGIWDVDRVSIIMGQHVTETLKRVLRYTASIQFWEGNLVVIVTI